MNSESETPTYAERNSARIAGFAYLGVFVFSIFANFFVFERLIVSGDALATTSNIVTNEFQFRIGIAAWIVVVVFDVLVAWALYLFLKPIDRNLSLLASWFRLVFAAIFGYSFVNYSVILRYFSGAEYLKAFETDEVQAQVMLLLGTHYFATRVSYVFFGLHIFLLGCLVLKSGYIPRILGILLLIASCGYFIDCFGNFLSAAYSSSEYTFLLFVGVPALIAELSFTLWLVFSGGGKGNFIESRQ